MRDALDSTWTLLFVILAAGIVTACGVKGPPLPPVADTPEKSERLDTAAQARSAESPPRPRPSPSPSPKGR